MLSRSGAHAIRAMVALAMVPPNTFCGVSELARTTDSPQNYLGKLLLQLSRQGLVESRKGLGGGFRLARRPDDISLFDVMAAIEDVGRWTDCAFAGRTCNGATPCMVHHRWSRMRDAFLSFLRETHIAQLAASHAPFDGPVSRNAFDQVREVTERS